jgi:hypothetical protein
VFCARIGLKKSECKVTYLVTGSRLMKHIYTRCGSALKPWWMTVCSMDRRRAVCRDVETPLFMEKILNGDRIKVIGQLFDVRLSDRAFVASQCVSWKRLGDRDVVVLYECFNNTG